MCVRVLRVGRALKACVVEVGCVGVGGEKLFFVVGGVVGREEEREGRSHHQSVVFSFSFKSNTHTLSLLSIYICTHSRIKTLTHVEEEAQAGIEPPAGGEAQEARKVCQGQRVRLLRTAVAVCVVFVFCVGWFVWCWGG